MQRINDKDLHITWLFQQFDDRIFICWSSDKVGQGFFYVVPHEL